MRFSFRQNSGVSTHTYGENKLDKGRSSPLQQKLSGVDSNSRDTLNKEGNAASLCNRCATYSDQPRGGELLEIRPQPDIFSIVDQVEPQKHETGTQKQPTTPSHQPFSLPHRSAKDELSVARVTELPKQGACQLPALRRGFLNGNVHKQNLKQVHRFTILI